MAEILLDNADDAIAFLEAVDDQSAEEVDSIEFGSGFGITVRLLADYHSEVPAQYLDAYHRQKRVIYQLVALIENGTADTKSLTAAQLEEYRYSVAVGEGSSVLKDNLPELLEKLFLEAVKKMSGDQVVFVIVGLAVIAACGYGWRVFLENRKEQRLEELAAGERRDAISTFTASSQAQVDKLAGVMEKMIEAGALGHKAVEVADEINSAQLRAAAQTEEVSVEGVLLDKGLAKELRGRSRRRAEEYKITKEMRVLDVNTADPNQTLVVIEDIESGEQHKVAFADRVVGLTKLEVVHEALRRRSTAVFRLSMKALDEDDHRVLSVLDVSSVAEPDDQEE